MSRTSPVRYQTVVFFCLTFFLLNFARPAVGPWTGGAPRPSPLLAAGLPEVARRVAFARTPAPAPAGREAAPAGLTTLPEVLGDAAVLLDPLDPGAWERAAMRLLDDAGEREERVEKGLRMAKEYSWDRAAERTLDVLRAAADGEHNRARESA